VSLPHDLGIVVIGRNEGDRLKACLHSIPILDRTVYVDSGSTDGSVAFARSLGVAVVELDPARPFSAARARNEGLDALLDRDPALRFVEMVDGDCAVAPGWLAAGYAALAADDRLAAVFGRRRERFPDRSLYNRLCDIEWDVPPGEARFIGGDAMLRVDAMRAAGGYAASLIAGEDPDLGFRLRQAGWRLACLPVEMTQHDAAILRFGQWWRRMARGGFAYAALVDRHGASADPEWRRATRRIGFWAGVLPALFITALVVAFWFPPALLAAMMFAALYPVQIARMTRREVNAGMSRSLALRRSALLTCAKFAEMAGIIRFHLMRATGAKARLIEYKTSGD